MKQVNLTTTTLTAFGAFAGQDHVDGYNNTLIGRYAGRDSNQWTL